MTEQKLPAIAPAARETVAQTAPEPDWGIVAVGTVLLAAIVLFIVLMGFQYSHRPFKDFGPVGDWFGGMLNPLVALLALIGLGKSVTIQRETLQKTTDGLREQLRLQRSQTSKQTFFDLLNLRANALNSIEWTGVHGSLKGRAALKAILKTLELVASNVPVDEIQEDLDRWQVPINCPNSAKPYVALFAAFYSKDPSSFATAWHQHILEEQGELGNLESELGHVFRATYQILKFAYQCPDFNAKERQDLANYLRAQMSEDEFALFALTALTSIGKKSRAAAIAFDLYEDRLYSIAWARELSNLFDHSDLENQAFAKNLGYAVLAREGSPC